MAGIFFMKNKNQVIVYCKSLRHKKILCQAAEDNLLCRSVSSYLAAWISLIVRYLDNEVTIEDISSKFDESVKLFKGDNESEN